MIEWGRNVLRRLRQIVLEAIVWGGVGLVLGLLLGWVIGAPPLFLALTGITCGLIGVWYVLEEKPR